MRTAMVRNKVLGVAIEVAHFPQHFTLALLPSHYPLMIGPITFLHLSSSNHTRMVVAKAKIDVRGEKLLVWVKRETFSSLSFSQIFWVPSKMVVTMFYPHPYIKCIVAHYHLSTPLCTLPEMSFTFICYPSITFTITFKGKLVHFLVFTTCVEEDYTTIMSKELCNIWTIL